MFIDSGCVDYALLALACVDLAVLICLCWADLVVLTTARNCMAAADRSLDSAQSPLALTTTSIESGLSLIWKELGAKHLALFQLLGYS